ncbi:hypothetical protein OGAPHI_006494 [Ogataea philodendri]|uniref:Uncharacterized protein n=1 Tax=Ogataea philodendri TaxID=1378263 RepID=A0A9P8NY85_9ASCO|nr:uncharacterized protein OGAPHI_006494 [Ogataea philodendri]KAH3661644.1 hypothetical protein OGAPHI_006494 [Ogataea philodendri]
MMDCGDRLETRRYVLETVDKGSSSNLTFRCIASSDTILLSLSRPSNSLRMYCLSSFLNELVFTSLPQFWKMNDSQLDLRIGSSR